MFAAGRVCTQPLLGPQVGMQKMHGLLAQCNIRIGVHVELHGVDGRLPMAIILLHSSGTLRLHDANCIPPAAMTQYHSERIRLPNLA